MHYRLTRTIFLGMWASALVGPALMANESAPSGSAAGGVILSTPQQRTLVTEKEKAALVLSEEQQQAMITAIMERKSHQPTPKEFKPEMGSAVPRVVFTHALPPRLANDIPVLKEYMYAHLDRAILVVDAMDKKVVAVIPLPANLVQESGGTPDEKSAAMKAVGGLGDLAPEQWRTLYQSATGEPQPVPQQPLLAGSDVPNNMILQPLAADVRAQVPRVQDLHYARLQDGRVLLIDPKNRKVAGVITQDEGMRSASGGKGAVSAGESGNQSKGPDSAPAADPLRQREESGKPSAYTGPKSSGQN